MGIATSMTLEDIYRRVPYRSLKHSSYFQVYERLFGPDVGKPITFVEIGILDGGSLHMWREYLGPEARIIGIDVNPAARKWESDGFEIIIGDQADPAFWRDLRNQLGQQVTILLDDGGHTNLQQVVTLREGVTLIHDGGLLVTEDTHASYLAEFGNPSRFSFIEFAKRVVDQINARHSRIAAPIGMGDCIACITFFESITVFHVDRPMCIESSPISNNGISMDAQDFRYDPKALLPRIVDWLDEALYDAPLAWRLRRFLPAVLGIRARLLDWRKRQVFRPPL